MKKFVPDHRNSPSTREQITFYDKLWADRPENLNSYELMRLSKILSGMTTVWNRAGSPPFEICDLGCGIGWLSNELTKFGSVTGVDFSPEGIEEAKRRWPHVNFDVADVTAYRPPKQFDVVVCSEVIEHVEDQEALINTIDYLLRPKGCLILTCPNGKIRRYYNGFLQPIENWPSPFELKRMVRTRFEIFHHETFVLEFAFAGPLRLRNSVKIRAVMGRFGALSLYDAIFEAFGYGLYQILCAQKISN